MSRDEILIAITKTKTILGVDRLSFKDFIKTSGINQHSIFKFFDSWSDACAAAGIQCGLKAENLVPNKPISPEECLSELKRVASDLGRDYISQEEFDAHSHLNAITPIRKFGSWKAALAAAGLQLSPNAYFEIPFSMLVDDFLSVAAELQCVPTLIQLSRRSKYSKYLFSSKHGGYSSFKSKVVTFLAEQGRNIPEYLGSIPVLYNQSMQEPLRSHEHGRTLGFRAFAHEPTYEQEVVGLFSVVAEELGFDITCMREEFPDCEARRKIPGPRKRYKACLIEFELRSSDYQRHGHPNKGCDLVVCWVHDWNGCTLEVLELKSAIRRLPGWR